MTPINNYDTWIKLQQRVNVQQNGQIPPSVFNGWYNDASLTLFKNFVEEFQLNQVMNDLLAPFQVFVNQLIASVTGQNWGLAKFPSDYEYFANASLLRQKEEDTCFCNSAFPFIDGDGKSQKYTDPDYAQMKINFAGNNVEEKQINLIDVSRWPSCLNHHTKGPTWNDPKMTQYAGGFRVAPKGITAIVLSYFKTPRESVFNYTISADDIAIYDPLTSVELEWSEQAQPYFLVELEKRYAAYVGETKIFEMAMSGK